MLGEELLFRGFLLPRMNGAFGRGDWVANGVLFAGYHLHVPWVVPAGLLDTFIFSYPSKRYRSALDRDRRAQRPERRPHGRGPRARRLSNICIAESTSKSCEPFRFAGLGASFVT
jgi:Type II CAAX prenyl endopeptidase Rce1-like